MTDAELNAIEAVARNPKYIEAADDFLPVNDVHRLVAEVRRLRLEIEAFAEVAEAAVANHNAPKGGQQAPYHDDFAHIQPSVAGRLAWWARRFREALK